MTPDQEEAVRRALAAAGRHERGDADPSLPAAVAARLDDVLSELVAERADRAGGSLGHRQGARQGHRHGHRSGRRQTPQILVAAAAVAVIAAAGGAVATGGFGLRDGLSRGDGQAASSTARGASPPATSAAAPLPESTVGAGPVAPGLRGPGDVHRLPALRSGSLAADVRRVAAAAAASLRADETPDQTPGEGTGQESGQAGSRDTEPTTGTGTGCVRPPASHGADVVDVRLDGRRATLVLAAPKDGSRTARVYRCTDVARPMARVVVPAR